MSAVSNEIPRKVYQLYGAPTSLYTGKVRGYLKYKGIPYSEQMSTYRNIRKVILPRTKKVMIPMILTPDDECVQDSSCIIDYLEERYTDYPINPESPKQKLTSMLLECYGDEWLLLPAMHYRWQYKRFHWWYILKKFGVAFGGDYPSYLHPAAGVLPAVAIYSAYRRVLGLTKEMGKAVERSYEELLAELEAHFKIYPYLLGNRPCMGDYGFLGPLYAHLYRDPYPGELMKEKAPHLAKWVERMHYQSDSHYGDFLPNDEIPETLMPILRRMTREHFPVIEDTGVRLRQWIAQNPGKSTIPRFIGKQEFSLEGVSAVRMVTPFSYWMFQRALNVYENAGEQKEILGKFIKDIDGFSAFANKLNHDLAYTKNKLRVSG